MRLVVETFGAGAADFVFLGSCVLGLYSRPTGGAFRHTLDADVASTLTPWSLQAERLADLCSRGVVEPDERVACRYHLPGKNVAVDVLSPDGINVGNVTEWFRQAIALARVFTLDGGIHVRAVTPPYFLALKLEAWAERGEDPQTDKDAEDIVAVATEVADLADRVRDAGIDAGISVLWRKALEHHGLDVGDLPELVRWHLHPVDAAEEGRVVDILVQCARGG